MANYRVRLAEEGDCEGIMELIIELAEYEKLADQVRITAEVLKRDGFGKEPFFHCLVAEDTSQDGGDESPRLVGYCLFYYIYSTWEGRSCYMEDLYVTPNCRGKGLGTAMWVQVTQTALARECSRLHWNVLDWNTPSIDLYKRRGAVDLTAAEGWHLFRMTRPVMEKFVDEHAGPLNS